MHARLLQRLLVPWKGRRGRLSRKGAIAALAAILLAVLFAFVALGVDTGIMAMTQTKLQNAVDAAALAASQEITAAVWAAGEGDGNANIDGNSIAVANARAMAARVAEENGVYVDPSVDVTFGKRNYDPATGAWPISWGESPYNVVRVVARRDNENTDQPDGKLPLAFGALVGHSSVKLTASASAFVEARDIVLVLDFSGSMNDDSSMRSFNKLGQANVEDNLDNMWQALVVAGPKWPGTNKSKFPAGGFGQIDSAYGTYKSSDKTSKVFDQLGLDQLDSHGKPVYPFPQAGKDSNGNPRSMPSANASEDSWKDYIDYVQDLSGTYRKRYGYRTLMDYLQERKYSNDDSEDLWRTPHYPFHAVKQGASLFIEFLDDLDFGDELGLVSYATTARREEVLDEEDKYINLSSDPITDVLTDINTIQRHKQAGHYSNTTNMGDGIKVARELMQEHMRYGARPTLLVMTDGQTNEKPYRWSLPYDWDWDELTDYDGDGRADYRTNDSDKQYAFWEAKQAIDCGFAIHTMSVGAGADRDLMQAIAFAGGGVWMDIPGGATVAEMEEQLLEAFGRIAAKVPPARLIYDDGAPTP